MSYILHNVGLPLFSLVRSGATRDICSTLAENNLTFRRALVVCGTSRTKFLARRVAKSLERGGQTVNSFPIEGATFREVDRIKQSAIEGFFPDVLIGIGGGSVIDVTKLAAAEKRLPWISVPTSASNDGFCSPVAVLRSDSARKSVGASMPIGVLADLAILRTAPRRLLLAGVGDLLSNLSAVNDWELAAKRGKASMNNLARMLALAGPRQVLAISKPRIDDPEFLQRMVEGLLLSGLSMEVCGTSRPCSGSEHLISHALDAAGASEALHGEQVGVATLLCLRLQDADPRPVRHFAEQLGMAVSPSDLGVRRADFLHAVLAAPGMREGRWTILNRRGMKGALEEHYNACFGTDH